MNKSKYQVGDRFYVMDTVEFKIIRVIEGTTEPVYIFELFANPIFKSVLTETELNIVLNAQKSA